MFIYFVSLVDIALVIYLCVAGGVERVSFSSKIMSKEVDSFGFINLTKQGNTSSVKVVLRRSGANAFVGPNASFLVHNGAEFLPVSTKNNYYVNWDCSKSITMGWTVYFDIKS